MTTERIETILATVQPPVERFRRNSRATDKEETVVNTKTCVSNTGHVKFSMKRINLGNTCCLQGTNYRKTNAALEMKRINRDSFWARAEVHKYKIQPLPHLVFHNTSHQKEITFKL